jgi:hypothetical protein
MPNTLARLRNLPLAHRQRWLRCLLACVAFSALHGLLGAWVVPAVADGPVVEICTPNGMQWVALDGAPSGTTGPADPDWPQGLSQPCAWAMAHVATPPTPLSGQRALVGDHEPMVRRADDKQWAARLPATADRVLMMAPMRAPPV